MHPWGVADPAASSQVPSNGLVFAWTQVVCDQAKHTAPNAISRTSDIFFMILFSPQEPKSTQSKEGAERLYWKKVKSPSQREVAEFNGLRSIFTKIMQTAQVVSRADTGERDKIADQMRLVEIALF